MKKLLSLMLMMLLMTTAALAENPFAPYVIATPEGAELTENEGVYTMVADTTRAVVQVIARVADDDPVEAIHRMMGQFDPQAIPGELLPLAEGFTGLTAVHEDRFESGADQINVMILAADGTLLILSIYDMGDDAEKADALLYAILPAITMNGVPLYKITDPDA